MTASHPSPGNGPFPLRTIALIGKYQSREILESLSLLAKNLYDRGVDVLVEEATASLSANLSHTETDPQVWMRCGYAEIGARADAAIVLGGDGTMLNAARHLARHRVPLAGVNQGRLGFMTDVAQADMLNCVDDLLAGRFVAEDRMLLSGEIVRDGRVIASNLALNEVVVDKGAIGRLIDFDLCVDGEFLYNLRSDGVIVSTPTGSTAYSLSANGPIMHPRVSGIALVPLCPHSLTNRPVLVGDHSAIEIRIVRADDSRAHFDGQVTFDMKSGDAMRIRRSKDSVRFLHPPGYSYFAMLREKLHWSRQPAIR
ncbi:MAG: NAD(+)/NADH kinase [Candidatus Accumulibacter sp.]|jgi:NAD+ kinase|nr:NAD(+)/NADH kinase [Accumulibacter sp.]